MTAMFYFARDIHLPFQLGLDSVQKYDSLGPKQQSHVPDFTIIALNLDCEDLTTQQDR